jgi:hypothetical protein
MGLLGPSLGVAASNRRRRQRQLEQEPPVRRQGQEQELLVRRPVRVGGDLGQPQPGEQRLHRHSTASTRFC